MLFDIGMNNIRDDVDAELKARLTLDIFTQLGYDAMTLSGHDFLLGSEFWREVESAVPFPIVTSNLRHSETGKMWGDPYLVLEKAGIRVAVIGLMSMSSFNGLPLDVDIRKYEIVPPEEAMAKALEELEGKYDVVVVLSQMLQDESKELMKGFPKINLVVTKDVATSKVPDQLEQDYFGYLRLTMQGLRVGYYSMVFDSNKQVVADKSEEIYLDAKTKEDPEIAKLVNEVYPLAE